MAAPARASEQFGTERSGVTNRSAHKVRAAARREAIARYLAGDSHPSNFEAMVRVLERSPNTGAEACDVCDGQGFRELAPHVIAEYDQKLEDRLLQLELKGRQLAEKQAEAMVVRPLTGHDAAVEERLREEAVFELHRVEEDILRLHENIERDRRKRLKRSLCRGCRGSGKSRRRRREERPGRADSMFSTAVCPGCVGKDDRNTHRDEEGKPLYPGLMHTHTGTSSGAARLRGPRRVHDPEDSGVYTIESDWRDDEAAERGDVCPVCVVREGTPGYVAPITCRPTQRVGDVEEDLKAQQVRTVEVNGEREGVEDEELDRFPTGDFVEEAAPSLDDAPGWLEEVAAEDETLAAAIALLAGDRADRECVLWPLTTPGRCLAEESPGHRQGDGYARLLELCEFELEEERTAEVGRARRRNLLGHVRREARLLKERAEARLGA